MSRAQLVNFLADLVEHGHLTVAEARVVLARFDAGQPIGLPNLLPEETPAAEKKSRWGLAWVSVFLMVGGSLGGRLTAAQRRRGQGLLRSRFETQARQLAAGVASGQQTATTWQRGMMTAVGSYATQMTVAGAGKLPDGDVQTLIDERIDAQAPYLDRFATQIAARQVVEREMSTAAIAARSDKYGGTGWGAYYMGQGSQAGFGYVERWETKDDGHVCRVCSPRSGQFFLPGLGPMPGWDCLGTCRCRRVLEYNEAEYLRLVGQPASATPKLQQPLKPPTETAIRKLAPAQREQPPTPPPLLPDLPELPDNELESIGGLSLAEGRAVREALMDRIGEFEPELTHLDLRHTELDAERKNLLAMPERMRTSTQVERVNAIDVELSEVRAARNVSLAQQRTILELPPGEQSSYRWSIRGSLTREQQAHFDDALAYINKVTRDRAGYFPVTIDPDVTRAYTEDGRIFTNGSETARFMVHEMGHSIEASVASDRWAMRQAFFDYRTAGDEVRSLAEDYPKANYRPEEVYKKDRWLFYYAGKIYPDFQDSEIISMGMQHLYEAPLRFAERDPEFFDFIVSYLRKP